MRASSSSDAGRRAGRSRWYWLLVVPIVLPLAVPLFNRVEPRLFGFPFFYWSQFALIGFVMLSTLIVYVLTNRDR